MVTTQIVCMECKKLVKVENKQIVSHHHGDGECPSSGTKYVPQRCTFSVSESPADVREFVDHIPLPPGAEVVSAHVLACEEHGPVAGIAIIRADKTPAMDRQMTSMGAEAIETRSSQDAVTTSSDAPLPVGKYGAN